MSQQAKDLYSGIKKIFPSSRRSSNGSFSFGRSSSSASQPPSGVGVGAGDGELSAAALAAANAHDQPARKKKERRPSFSFSSWKDKHRSSSSAASASAAPPASADQPKPRASENAGGAANGVVMTLPYGAQAATPKGYVSPSSAQQRGSFTSFYSSAPARGSLYNEPSAAVTKSHSAARTAGTTPASQGHSVAPHPPHSAFATTSFDLPATQPPKLGGRSISVDHTASRASRNSGRLVKDLPPADAGHSLLHYSSNSGRQARRSRSGSNSASTILANMPPSSTGSINSSSSTTVAGTRPSSVRAFRASMNELTTPTVLSSDPVTKPVTARRDSVGLYRASMSAMTSSTPAAGRASLDSRSLTLGQAAPPSAVLTPEKPKKKKKERRTSLSFTSHRKKTELASPVNPKPNSAAARTVDSRVVDDLTALVKPHSTTWDSDSDSDQETKRPTRGLDRRSQSMDFMEQAPTHLISKIWRKLPIQAKLIGGRGGVDLDLQKDRNSFSRSSSTKQLLLAKQKSRDAAESSGRRPPSPIPDENVFGDKGIRFKHDVIYFPSEGGEDGEYVAIESYDDVLVRVCHFAAHDKRRTTTKVQEFLERSMAFLHGTRTKHGGNVVSISNEEIRMWRRLALHDWSLEDSATPPPGHVLLTKSKDARSSSSVSTADSDESDVDPARPAPLKTTVLGDRSLSTMSETVDEEEAEEPEDEDLTLPERLSLTALREVVNYCVNFGERLFTTDEIDDLVRLEFLVEEDGWI